MILESRVSCYPKASVFDMSGITKKKEKVDFETQKSIFFLEKIISLNYVSLGFPQTLQNCFGMAADPSSNPKASELGLRLNN